MGRPKGPRVKAGVKPPAEAAASPAAPTSDAVRAAEELLDRLLPWLVPQGPELHADTTILEVSDPAQFVELVSDPAIGSLLLGRLAPNVALVDPVRASDLPDVLVRRGHMPKVQSS